MTQRDAVLQRVSRCLRTTWTQEIILLKEERVKRRDRKMEASPPNRLNFSLGAVPSPAKAPLQRDSRWEKRQRSSPQGDAGVRRGAAEEAVWWRGHSKQRNSAVPW